MALLRRAALSVPLLLPLIHSAIAEEDSRRTGRRQELAAAGGSEVSSNGPVVAEEWPLWPEGHVPTTAPAIAWAPAGSGKGPSGPEEINARGAISNIAKPRLRVWRPAEPHGAAMLLIAGGGLHHAELGHETSPTCQWLASNGVVAAELVYRLPDEGWFPLAPLQDTQRAMRLLRERAKTTGFHPDHLGIMGFSAGGYLAGHATVNPGFETYTALDAADRQSSRPDWAALIYPVLTMMPPFNHTQTKIHLLGHDPSMAACEAASLERHVSSGQCPTFLAQAEDDPISPVENTIGMFHALRAQKVKSTLHVFETGKHGWGMGAPGTEPAAWPSLFHTWAGLHGFLSA